MACADMGGKPEDVSGCTACGGGLAGCARSRLHANCAGPVYERLGQCSSRRPASVECTRVKPAPFCLTTQQVCEVEIQGVW